LIHTAEGEFFRHAVRQACERLKIPVTAIRERDLEERAKVMFGKAAKCGKPGLAWAWGKRRR